MSDTDRISAVAIYDTFGTVKAAFEPGSVTRITGRNGSGKSSIIRALMEVFEGGKDPTIIFRGAKKSVVIIKLESGVTITKTTTPKTSTVEITDKLGLAVAAPQTYINRLSEAIAVDPGKLLRMDVTTAPGRKAFCAELLKLMPIEFTPDSVIVACTYEDVTARRGAGVAELTGSKWIAERRTEVAIPKPVAPLSLDDLKKAVAQVTELRRRIGVSKDDADAAIRELQRSLPPDDGINHQAALEEAKEELAAIERHVAAERLVIEKAKGEALIAAEQEVNATKLTVNADIDARIRGLEQERKDRLAICQQALDGEKDRIATEAQAAVQQIEADAREPERAINERIGGLQERAENQHRASYTRQQIDKVTATALESGWKWERLTEVIRRLEGLRQDKLANLPVQGLEVSEGAALVDGIEWQHVNTARRVKVAMELSALRAGTLGMMLLDNVESLDPETRTELERAIIRDGWQLIEAMVDDRCVCGHEHRLDGGAIVEACHACGCRQWVGAPLKIEVLPEAA